MPSPNIAGVSRVKGSPASAGTRDVRVERLEEGLKAFADVDDNPTGAAVTVNTFDAGLSTAPSRVKAKGVVRTGDGDSGLTNAQIEAADPTVF